jgi:hypothetical protein
MVLKRQNDDLRSEAGELVELLACFKYASTDLSHEILGRLRANEDPLDVLADLKDAPPGSFVGSEMDTVFRARAQELDFADQDEEMLRGMGTEYTQLSLEYEEVSPERWLDGDGDSPNSASLGSQSSPSGPSSSPSDPSSEGTPPYEMEGCNEGPGSRLLGHSETVLFDQE